MACVLSGTAKGSSLFRTIEQVSEIARAEVGFQTLDLNRVGENDSAECDREEQLQNQRDDLYLPTAIIGEDDRKLGSIDSSVNISMHHNGEAVRGNGVILDLKGPGIDTRRYLLTSAHVVDKWGRVHPDGSIEVKHLKIASEACGTFLDPIRGAVAYDMWLKEQAKDLAIIELAEEPCSAVEGVVPAQYRESRMQELIENEEPVQKYGFYLPEDVKNAEKPREFSQIDGIPFPFKSYQSDCSVKRLKPELGGDLLIHSCDSQNKGSGSAMIHNDVLIGIHRGTTATSPVQNVAVQFHDENMEFIRDFIFNRRLGM